MYAVVNFFLATRRFIWRLVTILMIPSGIWRLFDGRWSGVFHIPLMFLIFTLGSTWKLIVLNEFIALIVWLSALIIWLVLCGFDVRENLRGRISVNQKNIISRILMVLMGLLCALFLWGVISGILMVSGVVDRPFSS